MLPDGTIVTEPGDYSVVLILDNGCDSTVNIMLIEDFDVDIGIPTVFTPNGDGVNDIFYVYPGNATLSQFVMTIYDRIGEVVFITNNIESGWDGTFKGKPMNSGVFLVVVNATNSAGIEEKFIQSIKLVR